ncbi:MAG: DUF86 domain-containing protein [Chloroflexota bacterium]
MKKDYKVLIGHILESITLIGVYIAGLSREEFFQNREVQDAVIRRLEIKGEAARHMPEDIKERNNDIPWQRIAGMRNILIHEYFGVDLNLTWRTATEDLPALKGKLQEILNA